MKATELIEALQKVVAEHGDVEIFRHNDEFNVAFDIEELAHEKGEIEVEVNPRWAYAGTRIRSWDYWVIK